jgi:hypothetical protein
MTGTGQRIAFVTRHNQRASLEIKSLWALVFSAVLSTRGHLGCSEPRASEGRVATGQNFETSCHHDLVRAQRGPGVYKGEGYWQKRMGTPWVKASEWQTAPLNS